MAIMMAIMTPTPYSIADARNHLTRLVREVEQGGSVGLTRRGRLVAVVVSEPEYRRLSADGAGLRQALRSFLKLRPPGGVLTARQAAALRDRRPGRTVSF
jgi:prevent-host-death family protein